MRRQGWYGQESQKKATAQALRKKKGCQAATASELHRCLINIHRAG
jgi:hypothetical protein